MTALSSNDEWDEWDAAECDAQWTAYVAEYGPEIEAEARELAGAIDDDADGM